MNKCAELGFGMLRLPSLNGNIDYAVTEAMIKEYMEEEFRYFDLHPGYMNGQSQTVFNTLISNKYPRESYLLANKMPYYDVKTYEDYIRIFNEELQECNVTFFDYYMLHAVTKEVFEMHERLGGFEFVFEQKKKGRIKFAGISFHDRPDLLEEILIKYPEIDFVYLQINFYDWHSSIICAKENYEVAKKYNKQIIVMEPIKGGSLVGDYAINGRKIHQKDVARISLEYVASLEGVNVILSGMSKVEQVVENRRTLKQFEGLSDEHIYSILTKIIEKKHKIQCTACKYCEKECPKRIPISEITNLINQYKINENERIKGGGFANYKNITYGKGKASECIQCRKCESKCPQKLEICKNMKEAA